MLRERALANAAQVEKACGAILGLVVRFQVITGTHLITLSEEEQEWRGITVHGDAVRDEEYENEELLATVTVVEDFDLNANFLAPLHSRTSKSTTETTTSLQKPSRTKKPPKDRYENKHARQREQTKQRARRTKKAELAGGRASRVNKSFNKTKGKHKSKR